MLWGPSGQAAAARLPASQFGLVVGTKVKAFRGVGNLTASDVTGFVPRDRLVLTDQAVSFIDAVEAVRDSRVWGVLRRARRRLLGLGPRRL